MELSVECIEGKHMLAGQWEKSQNQEEPVGHVTLWLAVIQAYGRCVLQSRHLGT